MALCRNTNRSHWAHSWDVSSEAVPSLSRPLLFPWFTAWVCSQRAVGRPEDSWIFLKVARRVAHLSVWRCMHACEYTALSLWPTLHPHSGSKRPFYLEETQSTEKVLTAFQIRRWKMGNTAPPQPPSLMLVSLFQCKLRLLWPNKGKQPCRT